MIHNDLREKVLCLTEIIRNYGSLVVALSGGVDSSFLLTFASKVLKEKLLAITAKSVIYSDRDLEDAINLTNKLGVRHIFFHSREMYIDKFLLNGRERCYFCKKSMFKLLDLLASKNGFANIAHGINTDDMYDYRPGFKAANELSVFSPLLEANFSKEDVRCMARYYGIDVWDKPATGCIATRIPYGTKINIKIIEKIKKAENYLINEGFNLCRVRHHGDSARIEINSSYIHSFSELKIRKKIIKIFKKIGYKYVSLDLEGYKRGSMNI